MKLLKQYLVNLKTNDLQAIVALAVMAMGGSLWYDRRYFFWPPHLQATLNDWRIDIVIIAVGASLLITTMFNPKNTALAKRLLVICGGIVLGLASLQLGHIIFTPEFRMGHTVIGDAVIFLLILHVTRER